MKVLIIIDKPNWAYQIIADALVKFNVNDGVKIYIESVKGNVNKIKKIYKKFDVFYVMGFQLYEKISFLPKNKTLVGIHSYHSWDNRKTYPDNRVYPNTKLVDFFNTFLAVNVISNNLFNIFKKSGVEKLYLTENGVDTSLFIPNINKNNDKFLVGFSGNNSHDWRKGIGEFIIPAAKKSGVELKVAMRKDLSYLSYEEMPGFYQDIDCYICASSSEGFGLSVIESGACAVPVISTKTGIGIDIISDGIDGFLVDRTVKEISNRIDILKNDTELCNSFGNLFRKKVKKRSDWGVVCPHWIDFFCG